MISTYNIADIIVQIRHRDDILFKFVHNELRQYEIRGGAKADCIIDIKANCGSFSVPEKAAYHYWWNGQVRMSRNGVSYVFWPNQALMRMDFSKRRIDLTYLESNKDILELLRWAIKWSIITAAESRGHIFIHGAAARYRNKNIVFAGDQGCGKSSCLLRLIHKGAKVITDDNVLVKGDSIASFCLWTSIKGDLAERFGINGLGRFKIEELSEEDLLGGIDMLIFPKVWNHSSSKVTRATKKAAAKELARIYSWETRLVPHKGMRSAISDYSKILENAETFNFYAGNDEREVRRSLLRLVDG